MRSIFASTRVRLLGAFFVLLAASTVATTVGERHLLLDDAIARVDTWMQSDAQQLRVLAERREAAGAAPADVQGLFQAYLRQNVPGDSQGLFTFIDGELVDFEHGRMLPATVAAEVGALGRGTTEDHGSTTLPGSGRARFLRVPVTDDGRVLGTLLMIADLSRTEARATRTARYSALLGFVVLIFATGIAWVVAGRILAPLRRLGETAAAISETDLTRRLDVRGDDELARLAATFNAMLDRLEAAFASQREFASDVGHELRTPITIIRAHLDLVGDDPAERQATLALVSDELLRMSRLVEGLLTLAKAERTDFLRREDLDLDELAEGLLARARGLGPREWVLDRADVGLIVADRERVTQAVMNLAANAVAHTGVGDRIVLGAELRRDEAVLSVCDGGQGIAVTDQTRIFQRSQGEGTGLGLAIVRVIAEAHGGHVSLDSAPGSGSRFAIHLPVNPEDNVL